MLLLKVPGSILSFAEEFRFSSLVGGHRLVMLGLIVSKNDPFTDQKAYGLSLIRKKWVRAKNAIQLCLYLPKRLVSELELDILMVAPRFSHRQGRGYEEDSADFLPFSFSTQRSSLHQTVIKSPPILTCPGFSVRCALPELQGHWPRVPCWSVVCSPCCLQPGGQLVVGYPGVSSVMCQDFHDFHGCHDFPPSRL